MKLKHFTGTILWLLLVTAFVFSQEEIQRKNINLYERELSFKADSLTHFFQLPDSLLIPDSDTIWVNEGHIQRGLQYEIDYLAGQISFKENIEKGSHVKIIYQRFPFALKKIYFRRLLQAGPLPADSLRGTTSAGKEPVRLIASKTEEYSASLSKSGSIVRGISIGSNQGLKLDSGLRMQVSGRVADKVDVIAALTDQNTPIQPEGNTQTLQEIDKVFVQLKSKNFQATLGDYQLQFSGTEFGQYSRKLQGAMGTARIGNAELTLSGAVSRGQYATNYFLGQEGNQGPYQLKGDRGQIDIIVLAGTERVWVDGELMTRGENNDYVIEYGNGQITFTRRRLITAESRITVDFQYSDQKFRRNLYGARSTVSLWSEKLKLGTTLIRESDDKDNPLDFTLSQENLEKLKQAGDQADSAYVSGARYMGIGKGNYTLVDWAGLRYYRYVGPDSGDYQVSFSYVGSGKGDYKLKGFGIYQYVGKGQGSYSPVILLSPARSHDLADFDLEFSPSSAISLSSELALSRLDQNSYSDKNDQDNQGLAYKVNLALKPQSLKLKNLNLGRLEFAGKYRLVNDRFQNIDRTTEVEYQRRWDLGAFARMGEEVKEFRGSYFPVSGFSLKGGYGEIKKGDDFNATRWELESNLGVRKLPQVDYRLELINSSDRGSAARKGDWKRQRAQALYQLWKFKPTLGFQQEIKKDIFSDTLQSGFRFDDYSGGLEFSPWNQLSTSAQLSRREDKDFQAGGFRLSSVANTHKYHLSLNNIRSFSAALEYTHREKDYKDPQETDKRTDLADFRASYAPFRRAIASDWHYQISNTQTSKRERVYLKVRPGEGNYRYDEDLKEYVPDPLGEYILRIMTTDEFIPVVELRASANLRLRPKDFIRKSRESKEKKKAFWSQALSRLSSETLMRLEERTRERDVWDIYRLNLSKFQRNEVTIFGTMFVRQDIHVMENDRNFSLRCRYLWNKEKNNQYLEGGQDRLQVERSARLIWRLSEKLSSQTELVNKRETRTFHFSGRSNRDIFSNEVSLDLSYRPEPLLEIALKSKLSWDKDIVPEPETKASLYSLIPRVNYSFRGKGRVSAQLDWSQVDTSPKNRIIPYEMVGGNRVGTSWRWDFSFEYRFSRNIQGSLSYNGRSEPGRPEVVHLGRAEMRAFF